MVVGDGVGQDGGQRGAPDDLGEGLHGVRLDRDVRPYAVGGEVGVDVLAGGEVPAEQGQSARREVAHGQRSGILAGGGDQAEGLREQRGRRDPGQVRPLEGEAELVLVGEQPGLDPVLGHFPDLQGDAGVRAVEPGDERAYEVRGEGGGQREAQVAAGEVGQVQDGALGRGQVP